MLFKFDQFKPVFIPIIYFTGDAKIHDIMQWASLFAGCCLVFAVQLGIQTLPFLLSGELFPSDIRAFCKSNTRSIACIFLVISLQLYPWLEDQINNSGTFYLYAGVIIICTPIVFIVLPETKDLSLHIVQFYFLPGQKRSYVDLLNR